MNIRNAWPSYTQAHCPDIRASVKTWKRVVLSHSPHIKPSTEQGKVELAREIKKLMATTGDGRDVNGYRITQKRILKCL